MKTTSKLTELDNYNIALNTGEILSLQQFTRQNSEFLIGKLKDFNDPYSVELKNTLQYNLGKKWSEVKTAIYEMEDRIDLVDSHQMYDMDTECALHEILYPSIEGLS